MELSKVDWRRLADCLQLTIELKIKRIEELESALREFLDDWENSSMWLINNMPTRIEKLKQLLQREDLKL